VSPGRATGSPAVLRIDASCRFCQRSAAFADRHGAGARVEDGAPADTVVLEEGGRVFTRSDAALRILRRMRWPWSWIGAAGLAVPRPLRDAAYRWVARHRHRLA
jgi:predicted DCC family thiol-disulfide oxidoreductase YuxK